MYARNRTGPLILFAVVAVIIVSAVIWRYAGRQDEVSPSNSQLEPAPLQQNASLSGTSASATTAAGPKTRQNASVGDRLRAASRKARSDGGQKTSNASAALQSLYRSEKVDPQWSAGMESRLQEVAGTFASEGATPTSLDIDCRSTTCKIDATHPDQTQSDDWAMMYMASVGSNVQRAFTRVVRNPDGTSSVVIYAVAR
jgi:murein L,D-transpeptidase YcbB/YkuD